MPELKQWKYRAKAIKRWENGHKKASGFAPSGREYQMFVTGFNMGWNAHKKCKRIGGE